MTNYIKRDDWRPLSEYHGGKAVFYFPAVKGSAHPSNDQSETYQFTKSFGFRKATKFFLFEEPAPEVVKRREM